MRVLFIAALLAVSACGKPPTEQEQVTWEQTIIAAPSPTPSQTPSEAPTEEPSPTPPVHTCGGMFESKCPQPNPHAPPHFFFPQPSASPQPEST